MIIEKKVWPGFFDDVLNGKKNFDIRLDDFECKPGDILLLREWDPNTKKYTGREIKKEVTYVFKIKDMKTFFSEDEIKKHGFQVISIK